MHSLINLQDFIRETGFRAWGHILEGKLSKFEQYCALSRHWTGNRSKLNVNKHKTHSVDINLRLNAVGHGLNLIYEKKKAAFIIL